MFRDVVGVGVLSGDFGEISRPRETFVIRGGVAVNLSAGLSLIRSVVDNSNAGCFDGGDSGLMLRVTGYEMVRTAYPTIAWIYCHYILYY